MSQEKKQDSDALPCFILDITFDPQYSFSPGSKGKNIQPTTVHAQSMKSRSPLWLHDGPGHWKEMTSLI